MSHSDRNRFARMMLQACFIVAIFVLGLLMIWQAVDVLLLIFAAILIAVLLDAAARPIARIMPWLGKGSIVLVMVAMIVALVGVFVAAGPDLVQQATRLGESVVSTAERFQQWAMSIEAVEQTVEKTVDQNGGSLTGMLPSPSGLLGSATTFLTATFGGLGSLVLVFILALYLALDPTSYQRSVLRLVPTRYRSQAHDITDEMATVLRHWLIGTCVTMAILGVGSFVALTLIGAPLALILATVVAITAFVPYVGALLSGLIMVLVGLSESVEMALWIAGLYVVLQVVETYLLTPIIQAKAVDVLPALLIAAEVLMGVLFGVLGLVLATPLAAIVSVLVQRLYVEEVVEADQNQHVILPDETTSIHQGAHS